MLFIILTPIFMLTLIGLAVWSIFYFGDHHQKDKELYKKRFFVAPQENTVFASVAGKQDPVFGIASKTRYLAEGGEIVPVNTDGKTISGFQAGQQIRKYDVIDTDELGKLGIVGSPGNVWPKEASRQLDLHLWGRYWIGLPPFRGLYFEKLKWSEWKSTTTFETNDREEYSFFLYTRTFAYAMTLVGAETEGGLPVNLKFTLYVRMMNPNVAWFYNEDWKKQLDSYALAAARRYVGSRPFRALATETVGKDEKLLFGAHIADLNWRIPRSYNPQGNNQSDERGVVERLGAFIESAQLERVDLTPEEALDAAGKATRAEFIAGQNALATIRTAEGESKRKEIEAVGEKNKKITESEGDQIAAVNRAKGDAEAKKIGADAGAYQADKEYAAVVAAGGVPIRVSENIRDSKLRTLATGGGTVLALSEDKSEESEKPPI